MSVTRVKVVAKSLHPNASKEERDRNFKILLSTFKKAVNDSGVLTKFKEKQVFESKGDRRRRKAKEAELVKMREAFSSKENVDQSNREVFELWNQLKICRLR